MKAERIPAEFPEISDFPSYTVIFWELPKLAAGAAPGYRRAYNADRFSVSDALDVHEVFAWAREAANGRGFQVFVDSRTGERIRLAGYDPTRDRDRSPSAFISDQQQAQTISEVDRAADA